VTFVDNIHEKNRQHCITYNLTFIPRACNVVPKQKIPLYFSKQKTLAPPKKFHPLSPRNKKS